MFLNILRRKDLPMKKYIMITMMIVLSLTTFTGCGKEKASTKGNSGTNVTEKIASGENLTIPVKEISEKASFYPVEVDGTQMEVIVVKDSDGNIRTAFNTCQICYDSGNGYYKQEGDNLVCQNCGNSFTMDQVGESAGGCNPWPILEEDKTETDSEIKISYEFLKESSDIFANWKVN